MSNKIIEKVIVFAVVVYVVLMMWDTIAVTLLGAPQISVYIGVSYALIYEIIRSVSYWLISKDEM